MAALGESHCSSARMPWGESRTPSDPALWCFRPRGCHSESTFEPGYAFVNPNCFASSASTILVGRSLGKVQFLKRCGTTA